MNRRFNLAENDNPDQGNQEQQHRMGAGFFLIMMLAFPLQYYLTDSYGGNFGRKLTILPYFSQCRSTKPECFYLYKEHQIRCGELPDADGNKREPSKLECRFGELC